MKKLILILTTLFLIVSCNLVKYGSSNDLFYGNEILGYQSELFDENSTVKNFTASQSTSTNTIRLSWQKVKGAHIYEIQRASLNSKVIPEDLNDKDYINSLDWEIVKNEELLTFDDVIKDKDPYTFYAYRVFAKNLQYDKQNKGSIVQVGSYLTTPNDINVSKGESDQFIYITFSPTPGVNLYNIYKGESEKVIASVSPQTIIVKNEEGLIETNYICKYLYDVRQNKEEGRELKFTVKSVGTNNTGNISTGTFSSSSNSFLGYSSILGAPTAPVLSVNNGQSSDSITCKFNTLGDDVSYVILRTKKGGIEEEIYNSNDSNSYVELVYDEEEKNYSFTDTDVQDNTEYTYSVYGINDDGIGKATSIVAYKLSAVQNVSLIPLKKDGNLGYQLQIKSPMGWTDKDLKKSLEYEIIQTYSDGSKITNNDITPSKADTDYPFYIVSENGEGTEIRKVEVFVKNTKTNAKTKAVSAQVYGIPDAPTSFKGTQNVWDSSIAPNSKCTGACDGYTYNQGKACSCIGTYPIILEWRKASTDTQSGTPADRYIITRLTDNKEFEVNGRDRYEDKNVAIGKKYTYKIKAVDALGRSKGELFTDECWPAISADQFLYEAIRHVLKPYGFQDEHPDWAKGAKNGGIWGKISAGFDGMGTGALGNASGEGLNGKKVYYYSAMAGLGGKIQFGFDDGFTTKDYIKSIDKEKIKSNTENGEEITLKREKMNDFDANVLNGYWSEVDASGNAKDENNDVTFYNNNKAYLTGMYVPEGYANFVDYSKIYTKSKKFVGTYRVGCYYNTLSGGIKFIDKQIAEKTISEREYSPR